MHINLRHEKCPRSFRGRFSIMTGCCFESVVLTAHHDLRYEQPEGAFSVATVVLFSLFTETPEVIVRSMLPCPPCTTPYGAVYGSKHVASQNFFLSDSDHHSTFILKYSYHSSQLLQVIFPKEFATRQNLSKPPNSNQENEINKKEVSSTSC